MCSFFAAGPSFGLRSLASGSLLRAPLLRLRFDLRMRPRPLLLDPFEAPIQRNPIVLSGPTHELVDRSECDQRIFELFADGFFMLQRHVARHRPADPQRHLACGCSLEQRFDRRGAGSVGGDSFVADADDKLLGQTMQRGRQFGRQFVHSVVFFRVRGQTSPQVVDIDLGFGMYGKTNLDPQRIQFEGQEGMASKRAWIIDGGRDRSFRIQESIEMFARFMVAREKHPLTVDVVLVAQCRMLVRTVHFHADSKRGEASDDSTRPRQETLFDLESRTRKRLRCRLFRSVGVEVRNTEMQRNLAHRVVRMFSFIAGMQEIAPQIPMKRVAPPPL